MNPFGFLFDIDGLVLLALLLHMNRATNDLLFISLYMLKKLCSLFHFLVDTSHSYDSFDVSCLWQMPTLGKQGWNDLNLFLEI